MVNLLNSQTQYEETGLAVDVLSSAGALATSVLDPSDHDASWTSRSLTGPVASWDNDDEDDDDDFVDDDDELDDDEDFDDDFFDDDDDEDLDEDFDDED